MNALPVWKQGNGGTGHNNTVLQQGLPAKKAPPDKREYTLMFVPHHGKSAFSLRIPIKALKITAAALGILMVLSLGTFIHYRHTVNVANSEKAELERLREVNASQNKQIEQLAKATAVLQEDIGRLNKLDAEIRRLVNSDEQPAASRSGTVRSTPQGGQGGPVVKPQAGELTNLVKELQATAKAREQSLSNLRDTLVERNARIAATPTIWPTYGDVTSRYGWRWGSDWHPGIDIANDYGTPIVATADGTVTFSGWYSGYGKMIQIDHHNSIVTVYAHNSENLVDVGQAIKKGDIIAYMGSTGYSTGPHCHYEVRVNGSTVNPANFL